MGNQYYKEVWQIAMDKLREEYKAANNEDEFIIWYKMKYVEDTVNSITVSVATPFMLQMVKSKGYFDKVQKVLQEMLGNENLSLNPIVVSENKSNFSDKETNTDKNNVSSGNANNSGDFENGLNNSSVMSNSSSKENNNFDKSGIKKSGNFAISIDSSALNSLPVDSFSSDSNNISNANVSNTSKNDDFANSFKKHPLLQEEFTFESFIPGENSNFAYNASFAVAKNPGKQYNPILLYGGSGLGKTHLMQAIGNYIYNNGGEKLKICYVSAESFTNEFILSTKEKKTNSFKNKYRNLDVLLLDDIHFLQNKDATQEELFYTFNALHEKHAQMVFTCDRPIKEIKNMKTRLVSRLANGLCIDITTPNYETRCAILQKKVEQMGQSIDPEIIDYIAHNVETNVRELEAALKQVFAYAELIDQKPTLEIAKNQLKDILTSNSPENISLDIIQKVIADNFQISISELKGKKKDKKYAIPRQIAIYIAREITEISYTELGNEFGKDHSTIMHAYKSIAEKIKIDQNLDSKIKLFIREIKEFKK